MQSNPTNYSDFNLKLGKKIRLIRKSRNFSLSQLAREMNVSYQQLQKYETGANRISAERLAEIAEHLGVEPICFFPEGQADEQIAILENYQLKQFTQKFLQIKNHNFKTLLLEIAESVLAIDAKTA